MLFDNALIDRARSLITLTEYSVPDREIEFEFADEIMPEFDQATDRMYFQLLLMDSTVIERSNSLADGALPVLGVALDGFDFTDLTLPDGRAGRLVETVFYPRQDDEDDVAPASVEQIAMMPMIRLSIARDRSALDAQVAFFRELIVVYVLLTGLMLAILVSTMIRRGLYPLKSLAKDVGRMDETNLSGGIQFSYQREVSELVLIKEQLSALAIRLGHAFEREKRFSSDVAHELYTPISELKLMAEVGKLSAHDADSIRSLLEDAENISDQMHGIVNDLFTLTDAESGTTERDLVEIDLADLVKEVVDSIRNGDQEFVSMGFTNNVVIGCTVFTDREKLRIIVRNLLSNAFSYGTGEGGVTVSSVAMAEDSTLSLVVENPVLDLNQNDLDRMRDRFWRKDQSRTGTKHAGLGLSIADAMANYLGLKIEFRLNGGGRLTASLHGLTACPGTS